MPVEIIGEFVTSSASREWLSAQATLAIRHIIKICGPPPPEMELGHSHCHYLPAWKIRTRSGSRAPAQGCNRNGTFRVS